MAKQNLQITIVDDSNFVKCDSGCGADWSRAENFNPARQLIKERFGNKIALNYLDLSQSVTDNTAEWQRKVSQDNLPLPLLVINGEVRIAGEFDLRMLLDVIDAETEIKSSR